MEVGILLIFKAMELVIIIKIYIRDNPYLLIIGIMKWVVNLF